MPKGQPLSDETRRKISEAAKSRYQNPEARAKTANALRGLKRPFKAKSEEHKQRIGDAHRGKPKPREQVEKQRASLLRTYSDRDYRERWARAAFAARGLIPNKSETLLLDLLEQEFPGIYRYNNFAFTLYGKIPDFVDEPGRRLVELYGEYWHKGAEPSERIGLFATYGYRTLVVWDYELKEEPVLIARLHAFHNQ